MAFFSSPKCASATPAYILDRLEEQNAARDNLIDKPPYPDATSSKLWLDWCADIKEQFPRPKEPLWRAGTPLPEEADLTKKMDWNSLQKTAGFDDVPRGPTYPRVMPYKPKDSSDGESQKYQNSLYHPEGVMMAYWKNYLYQTSSTSTGARGFSLLRGFERTIAATKLHPEARNWVAGHGVVLNKGQSPLRHITLPGSSAERLVQARPTIVFFGVLAVVGTALSTGRLIQKLVPRGVKSTDPRWETLSSEFDDYNLDPSHLERTLEDYDPTPSASAASQWSSKGSTPK